MSRIPFDRSDSSPTTIVTRSSLLQLDRGHAWAEGVDCHLPPGISSSLLGSRRLRHSPFSPISFSDISLPEGRCTITRPQSRCLREYLNGRWGHSRCTLPRCRSLLASEERRDWTRRDARRARRVVSASNLRQIQLPAPPPARPGMVIRRRIVCKYRFSILISSKNEDWQCLPISTSLL